MTVIELENPNLLGGLGVVSPTGSEQNKSLNINILKKPGVSAKTFRMNWLIPNQISIVSQLDKHRI